MMNEKTTLQKSIERTSTDVINQLHQLKGLDRHHLLMEHYEALITTWDDYEFDWIEQIKLKELPIIRKKKECN